MLPQHSDIEIAWYASIQQEPNDWKTVTTQFHIQEFSEYIAPLQDAVDLEIATAEERPLGVGVTSTAEYFDMEINMPISGKEAVKRLNEVMVEGMEVKSFRKIPDGKANAAMALVAAADYYVEFREGMEPETDWKNKIEDFVRQSEILIVKKTKKNEKEVDIRPYIYEMRLEESRIFLKLAAGSVKNTKPELVMEAFLAFLGQEFDSFCFTIHRAEVYADKGTEEYRNLISLEDLGEEIE